MHSESIATPVKWPIVEGFDTAFDSQSWCRSDLYNGMKNAQVLTLPLQLSVETQEARTADPYSQ